MSDEDVVFLDDVWERHKAFNNAAPDDVRIWHPYTAASAIKMIERVKPYQVFLDHDLSLDDIMCEVGQPTKEPTGMMVVDHILTMEEPPMEVYVHTCNGPAGQEMAKRLRTHPAGITVRVVPFPHLIQLMSQSTKEKR